MTPIIEEFHINVVFEGENVPTMTVYAAMDIPMNSGIPIHHYEVGHNEECMDTVMPDTFHNAIPMWLRPN